MQCIVTGSFDSFAGAARGASALVAGGFGHGEVSIVARAPVLRVPPAAALIAAALGAMIAPGSVFAWASDPEALFALAPALGALGGACVGALAGALVERRTRAHAEEVSVVVDLARAGDAEAILRARGAAVGRRALASRRPTARALPLVPYRP